MAYDRPTVPHTITTSASGLETHLDCPRKQWAAKTLKLPEPASQTRGFGTVAHAVLRRWLEADDLGRVTAGFTEGQTPGLPVDLYPSGWERVEERPGQWVELTAIEKDILPRLIEQAIREGYVQRWPGRKMEHRFGFHWDGDEPVVLVENYRGMRVCLCGSIDLFLPRSITDYKTTKSKRWALSPNKLSKSTQMLIYAGVLQRERIRAGKAPAEDIWFIHLTFCRDPNEPFVRRTPVEVPAHEIESAWQRFAAEGQQMIDIALDFPSRQIPPELALRGAAAPGDEHWFSVPGPRVGDACNKYGGCPRQQVCAGRDSVANHRATMLRLGAPFGSAPGNSNIPIGVVLEPAGSNQSFFPQTGDPMGILSQKLAGSPATPPGSPPPVYTPAPSSMPPAFPGTPAASGMVPPPAPGASRPAAPPPLAAPAPAAPQHPPATPAPWAVQGCPACGTSPHSGFNTKGEPCRICNSEQTKRNGVTSEFFETALTVDTISWRPKQGALSQEWIAWAQGNGLVLEGSSLIPALSGAAPAKAQEREGKPKGKRGRPKKEMEAVSEMLGEEIEEPFLPEESEEADATDIPEAADGSLAAIVRGPKRSVGKPAAGWRFYLGCAPQKGTASRQAVRFEDVFERLCAALAGASGKGYFELDTWKRREMLAAKAAEIAAVFHEDKADVVLISVSDEMKTLVAALRPHASEIIEAIAR